MSGEAITAGKELGEKLKESPVLKMNPEVLTKELVTSLKVANDTPLKQAVDHDRKYRRLNRKVSIERNKFRSDAVHNAVKEYFDHSLKLNAVWLVAEYDLDFIKAMSRIGGREMLPKELMLRIQAIVDDMDTEMSDLRSKVAIAIDAYNKGVSNGKR